MEILDATAGVSQVNGGSYLAFLDLLLEEEVTDRDKLRVFTAMKIVGLPMAKTIKEYDFSFHPNLDKKSAMEPFAMTFLSRQENVIFLGPPGDGKAHLAIALAIKACYHGFKVYVTTMNTLIAKLKESQAKGKAFLSSNWSLLTRSAICRSPERRRTSSSSSSPIATRETRPSSHRTRASPTGRSSSEFL